MKDLEEFGKEFIDCILGKCEANCIYCRKEQICLKEKELMVQKEEDLPKKRKSK